MLKDTDDLNSKVSLKISLLYKNPIHHEPLITTFANYTFINKNRKEKYFFKSNYEMIMKLICKRVNISLACSWQVKH